MTKTAIVIGGGVVGSACALRLQQRGIAVTLIDDAPATPRASWGNAGHIATEQAEPLASRAMIAGAPRRLFMRGGPLALPPRDIAAWLPFGLRLWRASAPARFAAGRAALRSLLADALPAWRRLAADMGDAALVQDDGHFVVWETPESATAGLAAWSRADTGTARFRLAEPYEVVKLREVTKARIVGAIRFSGTGQIAGHARLADAQSRAFAEVGGTVLTAQAVLQPAGDTFAVVANGEILHADTIVVAAGVGSAGLLASIGQRVPMIAERGYHIEADIDDRASGDAMQRPVVFEDRALIVTRFGARLRASSFIEFGRADRAPDPRKWARLERHVAVLGLPFDGPRTRWHGSRPTLPDYLPVIGRGPGNLVGAFGHNHLGLTLAPVTAERVAALVVDDAPTDPAFALTRF